MRAPDSLPDPSRGVGVPDPSMPFDHIVVVMMENHSFDNLLGGLSQVAQCDADGLSFGADGQPRNENPGPRGSVRAFAFPSTAQGPDVSQTWNATHEQIDGGAMDGFVRSVNAAQRMGYYPPDVVPFITSLAGTFTVANRWFNSAPCMTVPNRRFLLAGTAYGAVATSVAAVLDGSPPNGTIFDRLEAAHISWHNYFTDLPATIVIPSIIEHHLTHLRTIDHFFDDCRSGSLPAVSFVDPEAGALALLGVLIEKVPGLGSLGAHIASHGGSEEEPQNLAHGERWAHRVVQAVLDSPAWPRTLLVYLYDEHGGYYDHVPPPPAIPPDDIPPTLSAGDAPGGYDIHGIRVPAIVASPYARPGAVTNTIHDHTSVLATIEAKWNLPALTARDANAATVMDFLDPRTPAFLEPPRLAAPAAG